jgi:hypothetical protein
MIDVKELREMMEKAATQAAEEGVDIALVYTDKSVIHNDDGDVMERRNIDIKILARPTTS